MPCGHLLGKGWRWLSFVVSGCDVVTFILFAVEFLFLLYPIFIPRHFKKCKVLCFTLHSKNCVRVSVHPSVRLSVCTSVRQRIVFTLCWEHFNQFSSNLLWELILGRGVLGLQMDKFWQISTELGPWLTTLYLWHSFTDFLQTWYESRYCKGVFWDCRLVNFDK